MPIKLKKADFEIIVAWARGELPQEACGLIAGRRDGPDKIIEKIYPLTNMARSRERFDLDLREQLASVKDMRARGLAPLGNFHSHPETPARPSPEDLAMAHDSAASYLIVSLAEAEPVLKAFHIETRNNLVLEEEIIFL
ncbi:Mov34/MPN/PAD-1 family protein [Deltaproteobacteria bacterium]|nr:Mov34/MPN/PAD-1 family protein [Deltaproteobacteria bacterium]